MSTVTDIIAQARKKQLVMDSILKTTKYYTWKTKLSLI